MAYFKHSFSNLLMSLKYTVNIQQISAISMKTMKYHRSEYTNESANF